MIGNFLEFLSGSVFDLLDMLLNVLAPASAMNYTGQIYALMDSPIVQTSLSWVNYFLPIQQAAIVVAAWGAIMFAFVAFKLVIGFGRSAL